MLIFERDIAIDMGTNDVLLFVRGKGVQVREPTIVAVDKYTGKLLKVGREAQKMLGRTPASIVPIHPIANGVISDYDMTVAMLRDSCVDAAVQRAAQGVEAERRGIALTEEELAEAEQTARQLYDESYASLLSQATDADEDVRAARTEYELYASGQDYETILAYYTAEALNSKLREQEDAGITDPGEESIEQAYDQRVESDEANYADSPASFESAMTSGTLVTWMPEGYRTVKHILVIPDESVLTPYQEAKSELDTMQSELDSLNEQLLAATDDDPAEGEEAADPAALETQIAAQEAAIAAAEEALQPLADACFADVQDTLDEIQSRLDAGEDFQTLIDEYGEDPGMQNEPTATVGYYVSADSTTWDTAFRDAAMLLSNVGDVSEPVLDAVDSAVAAAVSAVWAAWEDCYE